MAIAAANARTGKFLWRVPVRGDFQVFSGMVLDGGTLYGQWASCDNNHAGVAAIDLATGNERWRTNTLYLGETVPDAWPQSALGGVYVTVGGALGATGSGRIVAINIADGKVRWTRTLPETTGDGISLDQAVLAVSTVPAGGVGGTIAALDRATGHVLWTRQLPAGAEASTIAADNSHIFAAYSGDLGDTTIAFDARTGKTAWKHAGRAPRPSLPAGHVVALETATGLVGLDSDTGEQRWQRTCLEDLGDRVDTADGRVVMGGGRPAAIHVVDLATGKDAWSQRRADDVIVTRANGIVLYDGHMPVQRGGQTLYDAATGARIGTPAELPEEPDQVTVPMQIDPDGRLILARGCPGRG